MPAKRPPFSALPLDPNGPAGNAWGLYGPKDALGTLNMLTPDVVVAASRSEIRTGERVSLDWQLTKPSYPSYSRPPFEHRIIKKEDKTGSDDHVNFNTQCSTQWDGLRHHAYKQSKKFYNGHSMDEFDDPTILGIDAWVENGGIVGRGVLLDYVSYCEKHNITPKDPLSNSAIPVSALLDIAKDQGVTFQPADILFMRLGFTKAYESLTAAQQEALPKRARAQFIGVAPNAESLRWMWECEFSAVAGDSPSFEQAPGDEAEWAGEPWAEEMQGGGLMHQWLLGGWGCPIGEMFDLETLSSKCQAMGRWSFFLTSVPLKVPGGVASPPNAIAIF